MIVLRPYQEEAKKALEEYRQKGGTKALVVAATGTGKRLMAVDYARNFKHVLFIAHRDELIEQALDDFNKEYPLNVGIIKGDKHELNQHITVSSVQTLYRRLDRIPKRLYDCVIIDECHHFMSRTFSHTALYFECDFLLGLTATPTRLDGLSMTNLFEKIVYEYPIERAIKEKYLCEIDAMRVKTDVDLSKVHTRMGDFSNEELSRTVDIPERNALIVEKYMQYANGRQGIAFGVDIMHAEHLRDAFVNKGFIAACVHSNLSKEDRRNIISSFKSGSIDIVTNCEILTEGFDYHDVGCLLMARPTKSLALYCLDSLTEVLTVNGWVNHKTIVGAIASNSSLLCVDISSLEIKESPIIAAIKRKLNPDEYFVSIKGQSCDIRVTNKHRMIYDTKRKNGWRFKNADELQKLSSGTYIPVAGIENVNKKLDLNNCDLKFIGLVMTDGTINKYNQQITISQSEVQPWINEIDEILNDCNLKYTKKLNNRNSGFKDTKYWTWTISKGIPRGNDKEKRGWDYLKEFMSKDFSEILIRNLTPDQFDSLIAGIHLGDGDKSLNAKGWTRRSFHISSGNLKFIERLQLCALLNGYRTGLTEYFYNTNPLYKLHLKKQNYIFVGEKIEKHSNWIKEDYKDELCWCVESNYGTLITRRNGKVSILGNCQMIGRSTRLKSEKYIERFGINSAIILDFVDNVGKHKLINCWEIEKDKPVEEKCLISEERRKKYVEQKEAAERERRNAKIESFYKHDKRVNLLELPKVSQMSGMWKRLQPTDIQVLFIKKLGIWEDGIDYTRGQISELISNSPATEAQIAALRKFGYDVSHGCTRGQAELAFKALQDKGLVKKRVDGNRIPPPLNFTR